MMPIQRITFIGLMLDLLQAKAFFISGKSGDYTGKFAAVSQGQSGYSDGLHCSSHTTGVLVHERHPALGGRFGSGSSPRWPLPSENVGECPLYFSPQGQGATLGVDVRSHDCPRTLLYVFPPIAFIPLIPLSRVRDGGLSMILVAPLMAREHWSAEIFFNFCPACHGHHHFTGTCYLRHGEKYSTPTQTS